MAELLARLVISMAVVMAVMALAARFVRHRQAMAPRPGSTATRRQAHSRGAATLLAGGRRPRSGPEVSVTCRQPLAKGAWVTVVETAGRKFVVGVTEQSVNLIAELTGPAASHSASAPLGSASTLQALDDQDWSQAGRMPASLDDVANEGRPENAWKLALDSLRERTIRR